MPQAAFSHIAVSKALLISGMFMPKLAFAAAVLAAALLFALLPDSLPLLLVGATSAARSHDPISWERATEKNKNT
jgi:membrane protein DedA with SNARE-associated domain